MPNSSQRWFRWSSRGAPSPHNWRWDVAGKGGREAEHEATQERLPFGTDIWTTKPEMRMRAHVSVSIYGPKRARLYAGERDSEHDYLWIEVGDHTQLNGPTYCWEELAEVLNEALRQRQQYRERIGDQVAREESREAER